MTLPGMPPAEYILDSKTHKKARKLLQSGVVDFIGSDSHNMENRRPNLRDAYDQLDNWGMEDVADQLAENAMQIFGL